MKVLAITLSTAALSAMVLLNAGSASAETKRPHAVLGEKIDSGLGEMPRYGAVAGQKVDSGLGDLPHYRYWADKTGRAPIGGADKLAQADTARK